MFRVAHPNTVLVPLIVLAASCGSADQQDVVPAGTGDTLLEPLPVEDRVVGPAPSTTTPAAVDPLACTEDVVTIAERVLVARRQRAPSPGCSEVDDRAETDGVCWDECSEGDRFVDFGLDPDAAGASTVPYVAMYRTAGGEIVQRAEILTVTPAGDRRSDTGSSEQRLVTGVESVDLSERVADSLAAADEYMSALASGRFDEAAAQLLAARPGPTDRDDLARLGEAGIIASSDVGARQLADGLERWCADAACGGPDDVTIDIAPDHRVRVVATYASGIGDFDVTFYAGTGDEGFFVEGLPPVLP